MSSLPPCSFRGPTGDSAQELTQPGGELFTQEQRELWAGKGYTCSQLVGPVCRGVTACPPPGEVLETHPDPSCADCVALSDDGDVRARALRGEGRASRHLPGLGQEEWP